MDNNYKCNSNKSREEQQKQDKKLGPVVTGGTKVKKENEAKKLVKSFIVEDAASVGSYILNEVIVPALKKTVQEVVTNGINRFLYGSSGASRSNTPSSRISYGSCYSQSNNRQIERETDITMRGYNYDEIVFETRGDAELVLDTMNEALDRYGMVSILDLYELADIPCDNYTLNKYGWKDLSRASVIMVRDGYIIKLPRALPLN